MNTDPAQWSAHRKADHVYFKKQLEPLSREGTLVDLGAGPTQFADLFLSFKKYIGVDFEPYEHVSVIADLTKDIPLDTASADVVVLSNVVEHIPTTESFFRECKRILVPGGHLVGTVPWMTPVHQEPHDYNRYTTYQLERMLTSAGFSTIEITPLGSAIDAYDTIELKTFDYLRQKRGGLLLELIRLARRLNMRLVRALYASLPAPAKIAESYGFSARS